MSSIYPNLVHQQMPLESRQHHTVPIRQSRIDASKLANIKSVPRQIRSRRKRWLELNQGYFESASIDLELSDPLAYDRLVRQHQTTAEREAEGRKRGWASTLETSLLRSEAKLAKADPGNPKYKGSLHAARSSNQARQAQREGPQIDWTIQDYYDEDKEVAGEDDQPSALLESRPEPPKTSQKVQQQSRNQWHDLLAQRFVDGHDENFDYDSVDRDELLDEEAAGQVVQDQWFEDEEEHLVGSPNGETGVQDF